MLAFREHSWLLVPSQSRWEAHINPNHRKPADIHWEIPLHYLAGGARWRRTKSWKRPSLDLLLHSFHPSLRHWTDLENIRHWELPTAQEEAGRMEFSRGYLNADYSPGGDGEAELDWIDDHIWRVAARDGGWFTIELAGFLDGQFPSAALAAPPLVTPDGQAAEPERSADFWKENAELYLVESLPLGIVCVRVPRNARDPVAYAEHRAQSLLGLERPEHAELRDYFNPAKAEPGHHHSDLVVTLHYHGDFQR
jgi:hypothetical protein